MTKIVDGILAWGSNLPELYEQIRLIAKRCEDLSFALFKKKFEIGSEISFAGLFNSPCFLHNNFSAFFYFFLIVIKVHCGFSFWPL